MDRPNETPATRRKSIITAKNIREYGIALREGWSWLIYIIVLFLLLHFYGDKAWFVAVFNYILNLVKKSKFNGS